MKLCIFLQSNCEIMMKNPREVQEDRDRGVQGVALPVFASIVSRVLGLSSGPDFLLCPTMNPGRRAGVVRIMSTVHVYKVRE